MDFSKNILFKCFLLCALLFSLQIIPRWWSDSMVMDEEWNLASSYYYWKQGDVWAAYGTTAPGALCALPLLFMDLKFQPIDIPDWRLRSLKLFFMDNPERLQAVTAAGRSVDLILGLLIGFFLYRAVRKSQPAWGMAALFLWAFEPTLLAFSGTAKTDMSVAFWFFISALYFNRIQSQGKILPFTAAGFLAGLAAAARYNGILILPVMLAMETLYGLHSGGGFRALARRLLLWLGLMTGFSLCLCLVYLPRYFHAGANGFPLLSYFFNLRAYTILRPEITGQLIYFANRFWTGGSTLSFPYHFFFKNTLPLLVLLAGGIAMGMSKKVFLPRWVWVPPLVYLGCFYLGDKSMNIRHALPAYPFLILIAARAFQWLWQTCGSSSRPWARYLLLPFLLWHAGSVLANFPRHIAYTNELMKTKDKAAYLYSFNWNLGQDMKRLAQLAREKGWKRVKLLTGQRTDPYFYGMPWESWTEQDFVKSQPGMVYVVDPSIVFDRPEYNNRITSCNSWLLRTRLSGTLGGTLNYYEIPGVWDPAVKDKSPEVNSFPYYKNGIPPYRQAKPIDRWIEP